jgi:hypothetical protein
MIGGHFFLLSSPTMAFAQEEKSFLEKLTQDKQLIEIEPSFPWKTYWL